MTAGANPRQLPLLFLPYPFLLLPENRITVPASQAIATAVVKLLQQSDQAIIGVVPSLNADVDGSELRVHDWGCAARVVRLVRPTSSAPTSSTFLITLLGVSRIQLVPPVTNPSLHTLVEHAIHEPVVNSTLTADVVENFRSAALKLLDRMIIDTSARPKTDWKRLKVIVEDVPNERTPWAADIIAGIVNFDWKDRLDYLSTADPDPRLQLATEMFTKYTSISEVSKKISLAVDESLSKHQKEFFLRQQLAAIQQELANLHRASRVPGSPSSTPASDLDDERDEADDLADLRSKIEAMEPGSEARKMGAREYKRLKRIPPSSVENGVVRSYLECLTSIPWPSITQSTSRSLEVLKDPAFLSSARKQLDNDHFGLDKIKRRLIEHLAVLRLKELQAARESEAAVSSPEAVTLPRKLQSTKAPILLLVGAPGCGKTSIAASLARALDRPFQRISLGGVRDEAEIRGHRRTYVASGPGSIVQALRKAGRPDPVILLDELDKVGHSSFHGDPAAALLEVLDPEQNHSFHDHYVAVPIDLSNVFFVATANSLETISAPLLDRCEIIRLSGYTYDEKLHIARQFLLPKQMKLNGLSLENLALSDEVLVNIVTRYTREAGVRSLERAVGAISRHKAVEWAECADTGDSSKYSPVVAEGDLVRILGLAPWEREDREREEKRGIVYGLVVLSEGEGGILPVETLMTPGSGKLRLTGSLGEVIRESGELALSWVKANAPRLGITASISQDPLKTPNPIDIHLHLPAGAQKKDGPSAGVAMICAFVSLLSGLTIPTTTAMTGEVTLRGRVTAVGGIKEKVLGAHRGGITKIIIPHANRKDVEQDVPREVRREIEFAFVSTVEEALEAAFGVAWRRTAGRLVTVESRL